MDYWGWKIIPPTSEIVESQFITSKFQPNKIRCIITFTFSWISIYYFQVLTEQALMYHLFRFSFKNIQQNWNDTSKILEIGIYRIGEVTYQKKINACVTSFYLIMIKKVSVLFLLQIKLDQSSIWSNTRYCRCWDDVGLLVVVLTWQKQLSWRLML